MKSKITIVFLCVLLAISAYAHIREYMRSRSDKKRIAELSANSSEGYAIIQKQYIHDSIEHVVIKEVPISSNAEKSIAVGKGYLDTLTKALNIATTKLEEVTKVNAQLVAENIALKPKKTGAVTKYEYRDRWLSINYNPDSNTADFKYDVSLNIAKYYKRKWLIGAKQYYIDIFSDDQRVTINSVKRFTLAEKRQKKWGLGINAGYSYSPFLNKLTPTIGIGLQYNLIAF